MSPPGLITSIRNRVPAGAIDGAESVVSVLLAILIATRLGAANLSWAAFAGYMVMRGHAADTLTRGALRIAGTLAGGALVLSLTPLLRLAPPNIVLAQFLVCTATLYLAIVGRRSYGWLFLGLTFAMTVLDRVESSLQPVTDFVTTRVLETVAGTAACVVVSLTSAVTLRRIWPGTRSRANSGPRWHPEAARHALEGGIAVALLTTVALFVHIPSPAQGAVTIMAAMLIPANSIGASGLAPVSTRVFHRVAGCLAGAACALPLLLLAQGWPPALLLGTVMGVVIGRQIEGGHHGYHYVGTQFTLAVLVTLVPDDYASASIGPGLARLMGILSGAAFLEAVLCVRYFLARRWIASPARNAAPGGDFGGE